MRQLNTRYIGESRSALLLQRSGIKEEAAALGRNGGQPRS
jgi:hypothetical protein